MCVIHTMRDISLINPTLSKVRKGFPIFDMKINISEDLNKTMRHAHFEVNVENTNRQNSL